MGSSAPKQSTWQRLTVPARNEIPLLDALRAASLVGILLIHYWISLRDFAPVAPWLVDTFLLHLDISVALFFVLSGCLISGGLYQEVQTKGEISYKNFYLRRVFRIFPAYYFFLILSLSFVVMNEAKIAHNTGIKSPTQNWYFDFLYISNYLPGLHAHTWTLSIEEQFYLVFPALAALLFKLSRRNLIIALVVLYFVPLLFRILAMATLPYGEYLARVSVASHTRCDDIIAGILVGVGGKNLFDSKRTHLIGIISLVLLMLALFLPDELPSWLIVIRPNFANLSFAGMTYWAINHDQVRIPKFLTALSRLSYSTYLWHMIAGAFGAGSVLHAVHRGDKITLGKLVVGFFASGLATLLFAYLSYRFVESPFLRLRDRFKTKKGEVAVPNNALTPATQPISL